MLRLNEEPDADQDGCRNRCLFRSRVGSQVIRYTKYKTIGKKAVNQIRNQNQKSELQNNQAGTRQNRKGVSCTISQ